MNCDVELIKRKMLVKYPFFGSVIANVDYKENMEIERACTDGMTIYFNPNSLKRIKMEEQIFIFAHEVCHIAFDHINRSEGKDFKIWDIATDGVINQFLKRDGLKIPNGMIDIPEAINYDAEELYEKLLKKNQQNKEQNSQGDLQKQRDSSGQKNSSDEENSFENQNNDVNHDTHSMWKDALKRKKENEEMKKQQENKLQQEIDKISDMGEKEAFHKNLEEKKQELETLKQVLSKELMKAGTSTNEEQFTIDDIGKSKPMIDWRYVLREAIQYDVDWSYKNAYIEDGVISANLEEQPLPETEILLDTSGSIDESLLKNFLRECKNILQYSKIKVGCFDDKFYGFHEIRNEKDIENMKFEGKGGTDFTVAVKAFTRRVENKIIFTDGYASMPDISLNAIWIVFGTEEIKPKGGKVIQINEEQLNRLYSLEQDMSYKRKKEL